MSSLEPLIVSIESAIARGLSFTRWVVKTSVESGSNNREIETAYAELCEHVSTLPIDDAIILWNRIRFPDRRDIGLPAIIRENNKVIQHEAEFRKDAKPL